MMRAIAWLLPWATQAVDWCPDALFAKPPPPLSLPVFLSAPGDATQREVAFEVSIGGSVVDAATAFSVKHAIGEDARDALVEAAHARELEARPSRARRGHHERARGLGFEKAGDAVAACWKGDGLSTGSFVECVGPRGRSYGSRGASRSLTHRREHGRRRYSIRTGIEFE